MSDLIVTIADIRASGQCMKGARNWAKTHDIDWSDFLRNGISIDTLEATDDALVHSIAAQARLRSTSAASK